MYSSDNYYIGILNLKYDPNINIKNIDTEKRMIRLEENGAIELNSSCGINYRYSVLTVFKNNSSEDNYLCLHDMNKYKNYKNDSHYCEIIMPLKDILPKLSFRTNSPISNEQAIELFNLVFNNKRKIKYTNELYNINKFYIGYLDICRSVNNEDKWKAINTPQILLLDNNCNKKHEYYKPDEDKTIPTRCYNIYETIFYEIGENRFYNLNNFQVYPNVKYKDTALNKSNGFCGCLISLDNFSNKKEITINEALKKEKKLVKKINLY